MAVVVTAAVFVVACSKDKDSGKITLDSPAVFFAQAGGSATVGFTAQNIKTLSATSKPTGWDEAVVDLAGATISVKAPSAEDIESGDAVKTGSFSFTGYTPGGTLVSATLFAGIVTTKDISAEVANSYIVTEPETNYLIDATRKGDGSQLATSYVNVVWQTASGFVQYADFEDGKASFYIGADSDDANKIKQGKAVITIASTDGSNKKAKVNVTVKAKTAANVDVTGISIVEAAHILNVADTYQVKAVVAPANATNKNVTWSTTNAQTATVDANGLVTAVNKGTADIVATTVSGNKSAKCTVTVASVARVSTDAQIATALKANVEYLYLETTEKIGIGSTITIPCLSKIDPELMVSVTPQMTA